MKLKEVIRGFCFGKLRYQKTWERLFHLSLAGMNIGAGADYANSGEENIVRILRKRITAQKPVLFDVGANVGEYTLMLHEYFPEAEIHSFEPSQNTYNILKKSTEKCGGGGLFCTNSALEKIRKTRRCIQTGMGPVLRAFTTGI